MGLHVKERPLVQGMLLGEQGILRPVTLLFLCTVLMLQFVTLNSGLLQIVTPILSSQNHHLFASPPAWRGWGSLEPQS